MTCARTDGVFWKQLQLALTCLVLLSKDSSLPCFDNTVVNGLTGRRVGVCWKRAALGVPKRVPWTHGCHATKLIEPCSSGLPRSLIL